MADYFLSDVHLRLDHPERGERLAKLVDRLAPTDRLTIVGDLCDFWFAARQINGDPRRCRGLRALVDFRERGGSITVLAGNHDASMGRFFERTLGATFEPNRIERTIGGQRTLITHGHRLGARTLWKAGLESGAFLFAFRRLPGAVADRLDRQLQATNDSHQAEFDARGLAVYREVAHRLAERYDLLILGHVHYPLDERIGSARLVILGGWQTGTAYLVVDDDGVPCHLVEPARVSR